MFCKVRGAARVVLFALIILLIACPSTSNASSYTHTSYSDFIQGNGDGNIVFTGDGEIALSEQVGTAVGGFRLVGQLPAKGSPVAITAARGCLYRVVGGYTHVYWTRIAEDGSIGEWYASEPMPYSPSSRPGVAVIGDYIYVSCQADLPTIVCGRLNADGSVAGNWNTSQYDYYWNGTIDLLRTASGTLYGAGYDRAWATDIDAAANLDGWTDSAHVRYMLGSGLDILNNSLYVTVGTPLHGISYGYLNEVGIAESMDWLFPPYDRNKANRALVASGGCLLGFGGIETSTSRAMMNGVLSVLDSDGTPQDRRAAPPLPIASYNSGTAYWQGYAYVAGGFSHSRAWLPYVYATELVRDGTPGPWIETTGMPTGLSHLQLVSTSSHVYAMGGLGGNAPYSPTAAVRSAPILESGELGQWEDMTPLPSARFHHAATAAGTSIYVAGGADSLNKVYATVWRAQIQADGELGQWQPQTPLPEVAWGHVLLAHNGYLYCVYGAATDTIRYGTESPVYSAQILPDGSVGEWRKVSLLPVPLVRDAATVVNERLYVIGGQWFNAVVYSAPLTTQGGLGDWTQQASLPYAIKGHAALAHDSSIYVIGGEMQPPNLKYLNYYPSVYGLPGSSVIFRATPNMDGSIGDWEILPGTPRANALRTGATMSGDTLYFIGGQPSDTQIPPCKDAYYSRIHTPETELPTVSGGRYVGIFRLERDEPMVSLHWSGEFGEGSGAKVRWRTATQADATFSAWSEFSAMDQIPIGRKASFLQYEVQLESANGNPAAVDSIRLVTDTTPPAITVSATPSVLWPPSGRLLPVTINGSCTDTESGVDSMKISITDEYGLPCNQVTDFGQTVRLRASREAFDRDGRAYIVRVTAVDRAGNEAKAYALVVCPHDLGHIRKLPRRWQVSPTP